MNGLHDDDTMRVVPGNEPVTEVTVHMHMVYGAGLPDPLDTLVLLHLMFMVAGGEKPTQSAVLAALRAEGIQNINGKGVGLVGRASVQGSFRNLIAAGFLRRVGQSNGAKGQFGAAGYELYRRPAYNPDWMPSAPLSADDASASPQVTPQIVTAPTVAGRKGRKHVSAGQTVGPVTAHGDTAGGVSAHGGKHVSAGQTVGSDSAHGSVSPPHPPVVGTTPPNPRATTVPSASADAGAGRGRGTRSARNGNPASMPEELQAIVRFLMELPAPFACGLRDAKNFAPRLLAAMPLLGYTEPDDVLVYDLTHRTAGGLKDPSSAIGARIDKLRARHVVLRDRNAPSVAHPRTAPDDVPPARAQHCGDLDCDPITRTRGVRDEAGILRVQQCPQCQQLG
ncbi:hypothetical protein ACFVFS_24080 [Kitasatospora sp. NPDC057692]|uniref:hypothetical protein n=1 Tax=Kitasatospora sp. NPDC057692 TaxID=3346215 RepID=UPI0036C5963D